MPSHVYLLFTLAFYAVGALHVLLQALTRRKLLTSWTVTATLIGFALHTASLAQRWTEAGHFPAVGLHDVSSFLAWAIVLVFLMTYTRTRVEALGLVVYPVAFALVLVSNMTPAAESDDPILKSFFLPIHATLAFLGYAALFVAFAMGLLYLVQERELKGRSPRRLYYILPSLERCDTIGGRSVEVGFGFLTLAIVTGMLWSYRARGVYWTGDAKEWTAIIAWVLYVVLVLARHRTGWGGRRAALLGILGFAAVVLTFVWVTVASGVASAAR
jgi:cytochrome c-type biogenesis protein CcsB